VLLYRIFDGAIGAISGLAAHLHAYFAAHRHPDAAADEYAYCTAVANTDSDSRDAYLHAYPDSYDYPDTDPISHPNAYLDDAAYVHFHSNANQHIPADQHVYTDQHGHSDHPTAASPNPIGYPYSYDPAAQRNAYRNCSSHTQPLITEGYDRSKNDSE
jgi:hypothetical protein